MQALVFAQPELAQQQSQENISLGIIQPLNFPYNLFLNLSNLTDPDSRFVYFFVYILGAKRIVMYGVYDKNTQTFSIDGACRYAPSQLATMVQEWKQHGNNYVANSVVNRPPLAALRRQFEAQGFTFTGTGVTTSAFGGTPSGQTITSQAEYVKDKYILGYYDNRISQEELDERYPGLLEAFIQQFEAATHPSMLMGDYDFKLTEYLADLSDQVRDYERNLNRTDLDRYLLPTLGQSIQEVVAKITQRFYDAVKTGQFETSTYYTALESCPDLQACEINPDAACSVYFYGDVTRGFANPQDRRLLL